MKHGMVPKISEEVCLSLTETFNREGLKPLTIELGKSQPYLIKVMVAAMAETYGTPIVRFA